MAIRDAVKSWSPKQHLYVLGIGLGLIFLFAVLTCFISLAYFNPGAFLAILALLAIGYLIGTFFSVLLLGRGKEE